MIKKLYEYELISTDKSEEYTPSRNYYFQERTAKEHNKQYVLSEVPRKLIKIKDSDVIETPSWWSGNVTKFKKNHKS